MKNKDANPHAKQQANPKGERNKPSGKWGKIFADAFHGLRQSWVPNLVVSAVFVLISPAILYFMKGKQGVVIGAALGVTILVWIVAVAVLRRLGEETEAPVESKASIPTPWLPPKIPENQSKVTIQMGELKSAFDVGLLVHKRIQLPYTFEKGDDGHVIFSLHKTLNEPMSTVIPIFMTVSDDRLYLECTIPLKDRTITIRANAPQSDIPADWDWNHNDAALEIVDSTRNPVFQCIYERPDKVVICARFFVGDTSVQIGRGSRVEIGQTISNLVKPLFKYPSGLYPGVLAE